MGELPISMNKENVVENICNGQKKVRQTKVAARRINLVNQVVEHEVMMEVEQPVEPESRLPLGVKDIDSEDSSNPLLCSEYAMETFAYLKQLQTRGLVKADYGAFKHGELFLLPFCDKNLTSSVLMKTSAGAQ